MQMKKRNRNRYHLPRLYLEYELIDKDGRLLRKGRRKRANSFVGNIIGLIFGLADFNTTASITPGLYAAEIRDRTNVLRNLRMSSSYTAAALSGQAGFGIRVGTGTTDVGIAQINLAAPIAHGTAAGQMLYGNTLVETITRTATEWFFRIIRPFTNATSASITINEVGLFILEGEAGTFVMLARDLTGGIPVPAGATITFRYIISYAV